MRKARNRAVPAPIGGWNARDSLDQMPETDAYLMDNWFPGLGKVDLRNGYTEHATGMTGAVETIAEYHAGATRKLIAAANGNIWDATAAGAASSLGSGFTSDRWQWVNFDGKLGLVNGADAPQSYDGTTLSAMTVSGTGLTVADLIGVNVFKSRTYFWESDSQNFWYSAINTLGGTLTEFPLSRVGQFGGNLIAMGTWTRDAGDGQDDLAVFVMSSGEVIIYQGSDPGSDFSMIGVFHIGAPLSIRGLAKIGPDLVVMTKDGYMPLSTAIQLGRINNKGAISDQINGAVVEAAQKYSGQFGWQAVLYPRGNMLVFNVPVSGGQYHQHVFNTITGAPCRFTGLNSSCFGIYNDRLYFGGTGVINLADQGNSDNGALIEGDCIPAPHYLGSRSLIKQVTGLQPVMIAEASLPLSIQTAADFNIPSESYNAPGYANVGSGGEWDDADWDDATWGGSTGIYNQWYSVGVIGMNILTRIKVKASNQPVGWYSINYLFKTGGVI